MTDRELRELLRQLPRPGASPGFSETVLRRAGDQAMSRQPPPRSQLLSLRWAATALVLVVTVAVLLVMADRRATAQRAARLDALRTEKSEILQELTELRRQVREAEPVLLLQDSEHGTVVLDLGQLRTVSEPPRTGLRPAANRRN